MEISKRVEKFIEDYTRNCSNELCAVEDRFGKKVISYHEWLTPDQARSAVEIAREELIDKVKALLLSEVLPCFMHGGEADEVVAMLDEKLLKDE